MGFARKIVSGGQQHRTRFHDSKGNLSMYSDHFFDLVIG